MRHIVLAVAHRYAAESEEEEEQNSKKGLSPSLLKFFEEMDNEKVRNPATGKDIKFQTAFGYGKGTKPYNTVLKVYKAWIKDSEGGEKPSEESEKSEEDSKQGAKPKMLGELTITGDDEDKKDMEEWKGRLPKGIASMSHEQISVLMGFEGSEASDKFDVRVEFDDMDPPPGIAYSTSGGPIQRMRRKLAKDKEGVFIYNDEIRVTSSAPKGTGTKIFANQIEEARKAGVGRLVCTAFRDDSRGFVGHYVWARLGYEGNIHEPASDDEEGNSNSKADIEKAVKAGDLPESFKDVENVSDFMKNPKAREWWKRNGWSFKGTFNTDPGSQSSQVFEAYQKVKK